VKLGLSCPPPPTGYFFDSQTFDPAGRAIGGYLLYGIYQILIISCALEKRYVQY
jgi:hypothetical protein